MFQICSGAPGGRWWIRRPDGFCLVDALGRNRYFKTKAAAEKALAAYLKAEKALAVYLKAEKALAAYLKAEKALAVYLKA